MTSFEIQIQVQLYANIIHVIAYKIFNFFSVCNLQYFDHLTYETYIKHKNKIKDYKFKIFICIYINHICILLFYSKIDNFLKYCIIISEKGKYDIFLIFDIMFGSLKISLLKSLYTLANDLKNHLT